MHYPQKTENRLTPAERQIFDAMVLAVRVKHEAYKTGQTYAWAVVHYFRFLKARRDLVAAPSEAKLKAYLDHIAPHCAAKTQNQRLCAIKRYYEQVLQKPLGDLGPWAYAKRPVRAPVWLNQSETRRLLSRSAIRSDFSMLALTLASFFSEVPLCHVVTEEAAT